MPGRQEGRSPSSAWPENGLAYHQLVDASDLLADDDSVIPLDKRVGNSLFQLTIDLGHVDCCRDSDPR
jgi:hypothetical protein